MVFLTKRHWFINCFSIPDAIGQATLTDKVDVPLTAYDEVPVRVVIDGYKMFYIDAIYGNNKLLFVNVEELFNTLDIQCVVAKDGNSLSGFIEKESQIYTINLNTKEIKVGNKIICTKNGLAKELGSLYMESSLFAEAFGITLTFNYRALTIMLKSNFELPILKQLRIEKQQNNVAKIRGEVSADTVVKRDYHFLKLGTMDYSFGSYQTWNGPANHQLSLGVGTELLYGEADVSVNYYSQYQFDNRQLFYLWRWVDNDKSLIRQAQLGKISNQTISFINSPIVGGAIRNTPTTIRKASGYYTITDHTEPNWSVELFINNVLVDYTKSDASGLYQFKVPIVYGYTTLKLKFYGPLGEERTDERTMNVPYTFMPAGEFEYGLSGGVLQDTLSSRFGRAEFNYGVSRILTIGGGAEYLSSIPNSPWIPFATATFQPFSKMTINAEYAHGVKARGLMNFYFRRDALIEIDYARFVEGQRATVFNAPEERKVKLSVPLKYRKMSGFARFDYTQLVYKAFSYNQGSAMFSAYYQQFSANASTQLNWIGNLQAYVISDLALSYRMKKGLTIRPSAQYDFTDGNLVNYKLAIEKYIPRGNFEISYQNNVLYNDYYINFSFKYDLPFARTNLSVSRNRNTTMTSESVQGSLAFGGGNGYVYGSNNSSISKGGLLLYPFLDQNYNGKFDKGERMIKISNVGIMGGRVIFNPKDSIVRIPDLNAFTNYLVEFQDNDLPNISWRFKKKVYQVLIDPNQFKRIDVPVVALGEVSGMAYINKDNGLKGLRRIAIKIHKKRAYEQTDGGKFSEMEAVFATPPVAQTLSESDGYIYYLGLEPGEYIARVDPEQLNNLRMTSSPEQIEFKISPSFEGDIVSGLDFVLTPIPEEEIPEVKTNLPEPVANKSYSALIQVATFTDEQKANAVRTELLKIAGDHPVKTIFEDGLYKVEINGFEDREEAIAFLPKLIDLGYTKAFVVRRTGAAEH
jgi:hypothetical protein